jgi:hypothetical protein
LDRYLGVAEEVGLSDEEMGAAESIVMAVSAGRIRAQFRKVESRHRGRGKER